MDRTAPRDVVGWCRRLADFTETAGRISRPSLSPPMRQVHDELGAWMRRIGMTVRVDAAGNLRGVLPAADARAPRLYLGSHLDTVPDAGAFDGILGVVWALAVAERVRDRPRAAAIEVIGFSDEEGVRFGAPFLGSRALAGTCDDALLARTDAAGITMRQALEDFGVPSRDLGDAEAQPGAIGYVECHIEQGPVLARRDRSIAIVDRIAGATRAVVTFVGEARHAGTTPMADRRDAVAAAARWIGVVEEVAARTPGAVATTGRVDVTPGAVNVIAGRCAATLDARHADDAVRLDVVSRLQAAAEAIARERGLGMTWDPRLDQPAVTMDAGLQAALARAVSSAGLPVEFLTSGAGHDAMVLATRMPAAMLFVRSPNGVSHHPDETVREEDVADALDVGAALVDELCGAARV